MRQSVFKMHRDVCVFFENKAKEQGLKQGEHDKQNVIIKYNEGNIVKLFCKHCNKTISFNVYDVLNKYKKTETIDGHVLKFCKYFIYGGCNITPTKTATKSSFVREKIKESLKI